MTERGGPQFVPRPARWRTGERPAWADRQIDVLSVADVAARLEGYVPTEIFRTPKTVPSGGRGPRSAVLIGMYDGDEGATMILTRRPEHMRKHAGEVAFPGGAVDDSDESLWAAAVREAHEEVGLDPATVAPIGELDRFVTGASFSLVTPFVGSIAGAPRLVPSPHEVDEILHVSIRELLDAGVYRREHWLWEGHWRTMHFFELIGDTVWGATAVMVHRLLELVTALDEPATG